MSYVKREQTEVLQPQKSCSVCGTVTTHETLAVLGARCQGCYKSYCRTDPEVRKFPPGVIPDTHLAWAHRLRWRHDRGEKLSAMQVEKYKQALRLA